MYKKAKGAAYFLVSVAGKISFAKNAFFKQLPKITFARPAGEIERFGLKENSPIYPLINYGAEKLNFLNYPDKYNYSDIFNVIMPEELTVTL